MISVQFHGITKQARSAHSLRGTDPVATFTAAEGQVYVVEAQDVSPFTQDWPLKKWRQLLVSERVELLQGLLEHVTHAPTLPRDGGDRLDPAARFRVSSQREDPYRKWNVNGFCAARAADYHLVKHVLGIGEKNPQRERERWSR